LRLPAYLQAGDVEPTLLGFIANNFGVIFLTSFYESGSAENISAWKHSFSTNRGSIVVCLLVELIFAFASMLFASLQVQHPLIKKVA